MCVGRFPHIVVHAREQSSFECAKKNPGRHKSGVTLYKALADHTRGPSNHYECQPDRRPYTLHHDVRGYLSGNVEGEQDREAVVVLDADEVKVLLQIIEARISNVGPVEET
jgi:hypothetical protein